MWWYFTSSVCFFLRTKCLLTWSHGDLIFTLQNNLPIKGHDRDHPLLKHDDVGGSEAKVVVVLEELLSGSQSELTGHDVPTKVWAQIQVFRRFKFNSSAPVWVLRQEIIPRNNAVRTMFRVGQLLNLAYPLGLDLIQGFRARQPNVVHPFRIRHTEASPLTTG